MDRAVLALSVAGSTVIRSDGTTHNSILHFLPQRRKSVVLPEPRSTLSISAFGSRMICECDQAAAGDRESPARVPDPRSGWCGPTEGRGR